VRHKLEYAEILDCCHSQQFKSLMTLSGLKKEVNNVCGFLLLVANEVYNLMGTGQDYDVDAQCRHTYGNSSFACRVCTLNLFFFLFLFVCLFFNSGTFCFVKLKW
jgi:hypothetical protein